jgi:hypothetical protein
MFYLSALPLIKCHPPPQLSDAYLLAECINVPDSKIAGQPIKKQLAGPL